MKGTIRNRGTEKAPRYQAMWWVIDGATGRRSQRAKSGFATRKAAQSYLTARLAELGTGTYVERSRQTFAQYCEVWLVARSRKVRTNTTAGYRSAATHALAAFGATELQKVQRGDVERVVTQLVSAGRTQRTVSFVLFVVRSVFEDALAEGLITRNPAARVEASGAPSKSRDAMSTDDLRTMYGYLAGERLHACWLFTVAGLRRSEVMGLRWTNVDLAAGTIAVRESRVDVTGGTETNAPKTRRGERTLTLPDDMLAALRALRERQAAEFGFEHVRTGALAVDEAGEPYRAERWSNDWTRHCRAAGISEVTLHAARHTSVTVMRENGVPDDVVAAWHGHDEVVMRRTYSHPRAEGLAAAGRALSSVLRGEPAATGTGRG